MGILDGLCGEDGDLVAVDLDRPLRRRRPFARLQPALDVRRQPDDLHLVLLQGKVSGEVDVGPADLVERLVCEGQGVTLI